MVKFDQMWFIFQHSLPCGPHTGLLPLVLQHLNSHGIEALIRILEKVLNCRYMYDLIISPILLPSQLFVHVWEQKKSQLVPNQDNMEGDQPVQSPSHAQQPFATTVCRSINMVKQDSLRQFPRPSPKCL